ncbi:sodium:solute symporter [Lacibacter sediminis]|uniref:Sodium:solute symporter n=1 Tax=Lacibacter sediminis TaxID=2760713 RepID=A0A7G5XBY7_9BACT|nr:sodium:solute symporter [Lacibacter sediminis]QNA42990.1 sodium:solute symporter [Lacibacter sediminis]
MNFQLTDWIVLIVTLLAVIVYGVYRSRHSKNLEGYFLSNRQMPWWVILLSIMGTQASAVTFLTAPGQAYTDGMRFVQYYFGLPFAMIVVCIVFVPVFHKLKLFTAYEYLEKRFDLKTRTFTSFLFLLSRGLSTGISIFAPSLVLSSMLGWDIYVTNIVTGGLLIVYTVTGGAKAVAYTQQVQFIIIYAAMFIAGYYAITSLPEGLGFTDALHVAGKAGKLNVITTGVTENGFDWKDRYNIWSGVIGGFFLALSYFGTDQSQVGRYLTAKDTRESRLGLLMNGFVKVPLQFLILIIGCLLFAYYSFFKAPAFFNKTQEAVVLKSSYANEYKEASNYYDQLQEQKKTVAIALTNARKTEQNAAVDVARKELQEIETKGKAIRTEMKSLIKKADPNADTNDTNYIFLRFVGDVLPTGLVGLIIAIIFLAAWGSIAAALNSLASCTMCDFHQKFSKKPLTEREEYRWGKIYTLLWGIFCMIIAFFAYNLGNSLIEAVNILGSWFYGTILGIFLVAFYLKQVKGNAVFIAAIISEVIVISVYYLDIISFLWLNVIGAVAVVLLSLIIQTLTGKEKA